ncbi:MAG: PilZ domain-containing protein, partial [Methylophaga sp.]
EKRQFQRMELSSQLKFRRVGDTKLFKGAMMDLSASGIRFITSEALNSGEFLQIVINSQHPQIAPLVAEGHVLRAVALTNEGNRYEISLTFTELR